MVVRVPNIPIVFHILWSPLRDSNPYYTLERGASLTCVCRLDEGALIVVSMKGLEPSYLDRKSNILTLR